MPFGAVVVVIGWWTSTYPTEELFWRAFPVAAAPGLDEFAMLVVTLSWYPGLPCWCLRPSAPMREEEFVAVPPFPSAMMCCGGGLPFS